jgi:hypothetical protein
MQPVGWLALLLALALFSASCGQEVPVADESAASLEEPTAPVEEPETLEEFFGWSEYDAETEEERWREQELEAQELIAECMAAEGFEYTPWIPDDEGADVWPGEGLTPEEFTAQWGYGMFTMMLHEADMMESGEQPWGEPQDDPNWAYADSLPEAEQEAYYRALEGDWESWFQEHQEEIEAAEQEGEWIGDPTYEDIGGCRNLAWESVGMGPNPELDEAWNELGPKFDQLWERIYADERVVAVNAEWSDCMGEAGFDFADEEEIWQYLDGLMMELWEGEDGSPDTTVPEDEPEEGDLEEEWSPFPFGVSRADIEALADEELEIAGADLACRRDHALDEIVDEVRAEYEAQFIAENRAQLEKIRELEQASRE